MYSLLISSEELSAHLTDPHWVICDVRHDLADVEKGRRAYAEGHLPGAHFLHLDEHLSGRKTGNNGRHPLPDPQAFASRLSAIGISNETQVVAYDDAGGPYAARLWWMLRWIGHEAVAVLDGGINQWQKDGRALTRDIPQAYAAQFAPRISDAMRVDASYIVDHLGKPDALVVDARAEERYRGLAETIDPVAGHIPGAVNRFFKDNLDAAGRFKPAAQLRREFDALLGGRPATQVINQCGSGVTAAHNLLAMEIAGLKGSKLYPGSWSEWCADPARPVARA
jgi:thiosulfate/3-mercaptopyruvate sulfurtransferase